MRITIDGATYEWIATDPWKWEQRSADVLEIEGPLEFRDRCPACRRGDIGAAVAHSWQEAIDRGWLIPVDP